MGAGLVSVGTGDREAAGAGFAEAETEGAAAFLDLTFAAGITVDLCGEELASEEGVASEEELASEEGVDSEEGVVSDEVAAIAG